jgi:hypothetical protein
MHSPSQTISGLLDVAVDIHVQRRLQRQAAEAQAADDAIALSAVDKLGRATGPGFRQ